MMTMLRSLASTVLLVGVAMPAMADQVTDQLDQAKTYYQDGDLAGASNELQFALQDIKAQLAEKYKAGFPDAPAGWTIEDSDDSGDSSAAMAILGGGTSVTRTYKQTDGEGTVTASLMLDNPMVQGFAAMMTNPAIMAQQPNARRLRMGRDNAIITFDKENQSGDATYLLGGGRMMLKLEGSNLSDGGAILEELTKGWKVDELKKLAGM